MLHGGVAMAVAMGVLLLAAPTGTSNYLEQRRAAAATEPRDTAHPVVVAARRHIPAGVLRVASANPWNLVDAAVATMAIARGDTLMTMLVDVGVDRAQAERAIKAISRHASPTGLQIGQELTIILSHPEDQAGSAELYAMSLALDNGFHAIAHRDDNGDFSSAIGSSPVAASDVAGITVATEGSGGGTEDPVLKRLVIRKGDTLLSRLVAMGTRRDDADEAIRALKGHVDLRRLQIGQEVVVVLGAEDARLAAVSVELDDVYVTADRDPDGDFDAHRSATPLSLAVPGITADPFILAPFGDTFADDDVTAAPARPGGPPLPQVKPIAASANSILERTIRIGRGDTLNERLIDVGVSAADAELAIAVLKTAFNPRKLQIGDRLTAYLNHAIAEDADGRLMAMRLAAGDQVFDVARVDGIFRIERTATLESLPPLPPQVARGSQEAWSILRRHEGEPAAESERFVEETFEIGEGDTLLKVLALAGANDRDAKAAVKALRPFVNPRRLQLGQTLTVIMDSRGGNDGRPQLLAISLPRDSGDFIVAAMIDGAFHADVTAAPFTMAGLIEGIADTGIAAAQTADVEVPLPTERPDSGKTVVASLGSVAVPGDQTSDGLASRLQRANGVIVSSLYQAAEDAGLPNEVMNDLVSALSYDVDFQRDLQRGDRFEVMYELFIDGEGDFVRYGSPLYAHLSLGGRDVRIYLYRPDDGPADYYHADGSSVRKTLLLTPISGARVTSNFGKRKDPFEGFTKMHKGIDFGAPKGTPVLAGGSGTIEYIGKYYGFGRFIRIRHSDALQTAYAHMSKFAKGLKVGSRVEQGQVIGYVGCTGSCTGNHLHYEVLVNGEQVDPNGVDLPTGRQLEGVELATFLQNRIELDRQFARLGGLDQLAAQ